LTCTERHGEDCELITDEARLAEVAAVIGGETELALDLEMDSLHHYREKVCLIQISTRTGNWLIDPLALQDLSPLAGPLGNGNTLIVMHGADYDIRSLHRDFGIEVSNLFDTMIAARFLGCTEFGLAALLKARFGIELDKKYQKADWSRRPLLPEMRAYAVADTTCLLPLHDQLYGELMTRGRLSWVEEECALVCRARVTEKEGPLFLSCKGAGRLKGRSLAVLEALLQMRASLASQLDRPPFKVFSAETLLEAAEKKPLTFGELACIKGMTPGQLNRYAARILETVASALALPDGELPCFPRQRRDEVPEGTKERLKRLKSWRREESLRLGLEPGVIAPNWLLEGIANATPATSEALEEIAGMRNWQKKLYGAEIPAVISAAASVP